jgi:hypothetical protein
MDKLKSVYRQVLPERLRKIVKEFRLERQFHYDAEIEFYGAYANLVRYVGINKLNYKQRRNVNWAHGWYADFFMEKSIQPYMACCNINFKKDNRINFVTRKTQEQFLRQFGYENVKAIGMPIVYVPKKEYKLKPNSLLVMPGHSLEGEKFETFEDDYLGLINSYRRDFDTITICVHPGCLKNGYWIEAFAKEGYKVIVGVGLSNLNSFQKLQKLMSEHEYMTTNCYGSHLMYASYFGSKVSVIGKEPTYQLDELLNSESWINEEDKSPIIESFNTVNMQNYKRYYPTFFVEHPLDAICHKEIADYELGVDQKIGKLEFDQIVGNIKY